MTKGKADVEELQVKMKRKSRRKVEKKKVTEMGRDNRKDEGQEDHRNRKIANKWMRK